MRMSAWIVGKLQWNLIVRKERIIQKSDNGRKHGADYKHANYFWEDIRKKNLGDCHDFYIQSDTLLLADVFEKLCCKCIEIDKLDSVYFLSTPGKE